MMPQTSAFLRQGLIAGLVTVLVLGSGIVLGSRNLRNYDPTLLLYTFGALFAAFAVAYRYTVWLQRPPTRLYWRRGWQLICQRRDVRRHLLALAGALLRNFAAQSFIRRRRWSRWLAHCCMSWGTMLAGAVTFPLVFGWIHFESQAHAPQVFQILVFGVRIGAFNAEVSWTRLVFFNLLNLSAVLVIVGVVLTLHRRLQDAGAVQQFGNDLVPLLLLLAVSATGLMLTFSMHALHGAGYTVISLLHALTVITMLLYLPFGKLFHIFQRPLHLAVTVYKQANAAAPPACCRLCGEAYAGAMHVADLQGVLTDVGLDWHLDGPVAHYMHVCPRCRRRQVGVAQGQALQSAPRTTHGAQAHHNGSVAQ